MPFRAHYIKGPESARLGGYVGVSGSDRPMPIGLLADSAGGQRLLTVDENCFVHNAAWLAASVAEAPHDSQTLSMRHLRSLGRMSRATLSLRQMIRGFARGIGVAGRFSTKRAGNVVLEEARDVDFEGFARVIEEIRPRRHQRHYR